MWSGLKEVPHLKYFALTAPDTCWAQVGDYVTIVVITDVACSDLKFTYEAQCVLNLQRMFTDSEIAAGAVVLTLR